jgi:hypothetical protein
MAARRTYRLTRNLHIYAGLFVSPFVVVFAPSVIFLNHAWLPWSGQSVAFARADSVTIDVPPIEDNLELAREVRARIDLAGEIDFTSRDLRTNRLMFPITRPGQRTNVRVDLETDAVIMRTRYTGAWDAMVYLHRMPGPHNVAIRGNWWITGVWGWLADSTVYVLLFLTATGIYLWLTVRTERKAGLIFLLAKPRQSVAESCLARIGRPCQRYRRSLDPGSWRLPLACAYVQAYPAVNAATGHRVRDRRPRVRR